MDLHRQAQAVCSESSERCECHWAPVGPGVPTEAAACTHSSPVCAAPLTHGDPMEMQTQEELLQLS